MTETHTCFIFNCLYNGGDRLTPSGLIYRALHTGLKGGLCDDLF